MKNGRTIPNKADQYYCTNSKMTPVEAGRDTVPHSQTRRGDRGEGDGRHGGRRPLHQLPPVRRHR